LPSEHARAAQEPPEQAALTIQLDQWRFMLDRMAEIQEKKRILNKKPETNRKTLKIKK
jgi:hypothetical protein